MTTGTAYFTSLQAAYRYYRPYGHNHAAVDQKITDGEIHVGRPATKDGERLTIIDGGTRWAIVEAGKPDLQQRLQTAFPALTDDHFAYHATDLYVVEIAGVREWLKANYQHFANVQTFKSQEGSNWAGAGKSCLDIPFAGKWGN